MHFHFVSIFPEIFESFTQTSLIQKAREKGLLEISFTNPRDFCTDKHKQVDDEIYGGGQGMLMKAEPVIQAIESIVGADIIRLTNFNIIYLSPSQTAFNQQLAQNYASEYDYLIFVCGRYEGIDFRFVEHMQKTYPDNFVRLSLGQFVTLGGEVPAMVMTEAIARLVPDVIKEETSRQDESYAVAKNMQNIEYPQYTRPEEVRGMKVPEVLLSGHHAKIQDRKNENEGTCKNT